MTRRRSGQPWAWLLAAGALLIAVAGALFLGVAGPLGRSLASMMLFGVLGVVPIAYVFLRGVAWDDARRDRYVDPHATSELPPFEMPSHEERLLGWDKKRLPR